MGKAKKLILIFSLVLIVLASSFKALQPLQNSDSITVQIGHYNYTFAKDNFLNWRTIYTNCNQEGLTIWTTLPNFEPNLGKSTKAFFSAPDPDDLTIRATIHKISPLATTFREKGLGNPKDSISLRPLKKIESQKYGLNWLQADIPELTSYNSQTKHYFWAHDAFYNVENGKIPRVIECSTPYTVPNPQCKHQFILNDDAVVEINYGLNFLVNWKDIEDKARTFFGKATLSHTDNPMPVCVFPYEKLLKAKGMRCC